MCTYIYTQIYMRAETTPLRCKGAYAAYAHACLYTCVYVYIYIHTHTHASYVCTGCTFDCVDTPCALIVVGHSSRIYAKLLAFAICSILCYV